MTVSRKHWKALLCLLLMFLALPAFAQTFGYVGVLSDGVGPVANGNYDIRMRLFDAATNGNELAPADEQLAVPVQGGNFALELDFGAAILSAPNAWLQLEVRANGAPSYDVQLPRQRITGAPLALFAEHAGMIDWSGIENVPAGLADGVDNDSLAAISCGDGALLSYNASGASWQCGAAGADGKTVLNGSGAPAGALGSLGDFYIDTAVPAIYGPKSAGGWGSATALQGPPGDTGPEGPQGPPGQDAGTLPYPDAVGMLVFAGSNINTTPPTPGVVVRSLSFEITRDVIAGTPPQFAQPKLTLDIEIDPGASMPELFSAATLNSTFSNATLSFGSGGSAFTLLQLGGVRVDWLTLEPASASGQVDLARLRLLFTSVQMTYAGQSLGYNLVTATVTATPSPLNVCNPVFNPMFVSNPLSSDGRLGMPVLASGSPLRFERAPNNSPGGGGEPYRQPMFDAPTFSYNESMRLQSMNDAVFSCAAYRTLDTTLLALAKLDRYLGAEASTPALSLEWQDVFFTGFNLRTRGDGALEAAWTLFPNTSLTVRDPDGFSVWDFAPPVP
jgi:hypothetical protein